MIHHMTTILRTALALGFTACATAAIAGPKEDMMAADKAFSAMSVAKGAHAAFLAYVADDVREFDGDHPPIVGKAALAQYYAGHPEKPGTQLSWAPVEADASPDGGLGWTRGTWRYSATGKDGKPVAATGYYVTEWKKQPDGQYKFTLDIGGADPAPAQ